MECEVSMECELQEHPMAQALAMDGSIYSYSAGPSVANFICIDELEIINQCISLRFQNKFSTMPLSYGDYFSEKNKFIVCIAMNFIEKRIKILGFILFRYQEIGTIEILDKVFYNDRDYMYKMFPEFSKINLGASCVKAFSSFVDSLDYKCNWHHRLIVPNFVLELI